MDWKKNIRDELPGKIDPEYLTEIADRKRVLEIQVGQLSFGILGLFIKINTAPQKVKTELYNTFAIYQEIIRKIHR